MFKNWHAIWHIGTPSWNLGTSFGRLTRVLARWRVKMKSWHAFGTLKRWHAGTLACRLSKLTMNELSTNNGLTLFLSMVGNTNPQKNWLCEILPLYYIWSAHAFYKHLPIETWSLNTVKKMKTMSFTKSNGFRWKECKTFFGFLEITFFLYVL